MNETGALGYFKYAMYILGIALGLLAVFYPTQIGLYAGYVLLVVALAAAVIFPVIYTISHPKEAIYTILGFVAIAVIFAISYAIADGEVVMGIKEGVMVQAADESTSKLVGAGLNTFIALLFIAAIALIWTELSSFFR